MGEIHSDVTLENTVDRGVFDRGHGQEADWSWPGSEHRLRAFAAASAVSARSAPGRPAAAGWR